MEKSKLLSVVFILLSVTFFGCSDEDDEMSNKETGQLSVKLTDAPSDDTNVQGTFVTISDVKVDGESIEGFNKQTIEISAYQQGDAKLLISDEVEARSYNSITLVLDYESDASGDSPGCYVLTDDNQKHDLSAESQTQYEITFQKDFDVATNGQTSLVVDFNLRKAVTRNTEGSSESEYKFVTATEMQNAVRLVKENNAGEIEGEVSGWVDADNELYVFVYKKGEFNFSAETEGQGTSNVLFANAVTSAKVQEDGSYRLAYLEEGEYEVHVASYQQSMSHFVFHAMLEAYSNLADLILDSISVSSETSVEVNITVTGLM